MTEPYRDDRASLAAENERLREEVARLRGERTSRVRWSLAVAALLAIDAGGFVFIRDAVNSASDVRVGLGMALAATLFVLHGIAAWRATRRGN